ncbi:[LysW]-lysine hydrolase [Anaerolineales bacterium]
MTFTRSNLETIVSDAEAENLLETLVGIESPSRSENKASQALVHWMSEHGFESYVDEVGNAVGIRGTGAKTIILLGHIDTFSGNPPVHIKDRLLYGRGSVDAKGPLCTFAVAAARAIIPKNYKVIVVGAVEEEVSSSKGARHILSKYKADICIIGEPSQWDRITIGYKGRLLMEWLWRGDMTHSASNQDSPAEIAIAYWNQIRQHIDSLNQDFNSTFEKIDLTLQHIETDIDGAYGLAKMILGFRLPPSINNISNLIQTLSPPLPVGATIRSYGFETAFESEQNSSLARYFRKSIRAHQGNPRFVKKTGTSDMNIVGPVWECPILAYGPGDSSLDHTPNEHLNLDEYQQAIKVLTSVIECYQDED